MLLSIQKVFSGVVLDLVQQVGRPILPLLLTLCGLLQRHSHQKLEENVAVDPNSDRAQMAHYQFNFQIQK